MNVAAPSTRSVSEGALPKITFPFTVNNSVSKSCISAIPLIFILPAFKAPIVLIFPNDVITVEFNAPVWTVPDVVIDVAVNDPVFAVPVVVILAAVNEFVKTKFPVPVKYINCTAPVGLLRPPRSQLNCAADTSICAFIA